MKKQALALLVITALAAWFVLPPGAGIAQNQPGTGSNTVTVQPTTPWFATIPITATTAVSNATTLTIPAPAGGQYNYVCMLSLELNTSAGGPAATTNAVTTSSNFNSWAIKISQPATVNIDTGVMTYFASTPAQGCVKSAAPGTATVFTGPSPAADTAWTWNALYYQAP